ncbi:pentatricopeptide repeat-containing protein At1g11900-like isoform X3 [Populus nigra]|uniref:pentatricopeptide repeat-containing protein At1g11900-like isoform X3 n=1 Tax=Populus nigra TaxID=3691 RepID=UPI002B278A78|nr:pentatricopeptide repeat-containing protein At1g11900-like isoform X3 [Populus nigra]
MRNFVNVVARSFSLSSSLLSHLHKVQFSPRKNRIISILVGSQISPHLATITEVIDHCKQLTTRVSFDEGEVKDDNLNQMLIAVENAPESATRKIGTAYVHNLCKAGNLFTAVFKDLIVSCQSLPSTSYLKLARGFVKKNDDVQLLRLVKEVSEMTFPSSMMVVNRIIFAFAECGQFDKALLIFKQMEDLKCKPDLVTYNTVLDLLGHAGRIDEMLCEFASMKEAGILPDFISYNTLLNHLRKVGRLDLCSVYSRDMVESGIEPDLLTYTALIGSFGQSGNIEESLRLFNEMKTKQIRPSIYIYRSLIASLKKMGKVELAMTLLEEMNASMSNLASHKDFKRTRK